MQAIQINKPSGARDVPLDVSFRVDALDLLPVSGRNGQGKTTPASYTHLRDHETVLDLE